jgi:hypothetical protein
VAQSLAAIAGICRQISDGNADRPRKRPLTMNAEAQAGVKDVEIDRC